MNELINVITAKLALGPEIRDSLSDYFEDEQFPRHHLLLKPGQVAYKIYFISEGFAHLFHEEDGDRTTAVFAGKGEFITSFKSFVFASPSRVGIELLSECKLLSITHDNLNELCSKHKAFEKLSKHLIYQHALQKTRMSYAFKLQRAPERLRVLLETYPDLFVYASKRMVASGIGITPAALSRILPQFTDLIYIKPKSENKDELYISPEVSMSAEKLIRYLSQFRPLTKEYQEYLEHNAVLQKLKKGQILIWPGEVCTRQWFILEGAAREYITDEEGSEIVTNFWMEGELLMDAESFIQGTQAKKYFQCLEDMDVMMLSRSQVEHIFQTFAESNPIANAILLKDKNKTEVKQSFNSLSAEQKFERFNRFSQEPVFIARFCVLP
ncbi:MAG TPA: cyclic nucleotide-binding domain-containing protein [Sphingobacteriaceae bacterium]